MAHSQSWLTKLHRALGLVQFPFFFGSPDLREELMLALLLKEERINIYYLKRWMTFLIELPRKGRRTTWNPLELLLEKPSYKVDIYHPILNLVVHHIDHVLCLDASILWSQWYSELTVFQWSHIIANVRPICMQPPEHFSPSNPSKETRSMQSYKFRRMFLNNPNSRPAWSLLKLVDCQRTIIRLSRELLPTRENAWGEILHCYILHAADHRLHFSIPIMSMQCCSYTI